MNDWLNYYQHFPERLSPEIGLGGNWALSWYSLMYLAALATVFGLLRYRLKKGEGDSLFSDQKSGKERINLLIDFLLVAFWGLLLGARLGYVFFYDFAFYLSDPLAIISPFDGDGNFIGIYGMSYHGGLLGALLFGYLFLRKKKIDFGRFSDWAIPAIPAGYFWGRIGNFLNGELYGRVTQKPWGMRFPGDFSGALRHPSQLYEAFLEGAVLFSVFWIFRNRKSWQGKFLPLYLAGYGAARFWVEFFRDPDPQLGLLWLGLTMGQFLSLAMVFAGVAILIWKGRRKMVK